MNQILSGVPVESLCLTSGILSDVMFGLSDYLCSFRAGHFTPNVRPGQTHCERIVQELIQQYQQLSSQKLSEQLNF